MTAYLPSVIVIFLITTAGNIACRARISHETSVIKFAGYQDQTRNQKYTYSPYYKGPVCTPKEPIRYPKSNEEVIEIVREAIRKNLTCKAVGALHSASDIVCTDGIVMEMRGIREVYMNPDLTVSAGAGLNIREVTNYLLTQGRALMGIPGFGNVTVGGATGTGAHGSSIKHPASISEQVVGMLIVDGLGQVRTIDKPEDLLAFRVHLGLLGIILQVRFKTVPLFKVRAHNYVVSDEILTNGQALKMAEETDQISLYWFPSMRKVVVANWTAVDVNTPGNADTNDHVPSSTTTWNFYINRIADFAQRHDSLQTINLAQAFSLSSLIRTLPDVIPIYSEDGYSVQNPAVGYYHRMFAPICNSTGWKQCPWFHGSNPFTILDNELSVDMSRLSDLVSTVRDILSKYPAVFPIQGILLRFSESTKTYMATGYGRNSLHFEFYMNTRRNPYDDASSGLAAYQAIMQSLAFNYSGRSHWGKSGGYYHKKELIEMKLDPKARKLFLSKMKEFDPNEVFMNKFGRRLRGIATEMDGDPQTKHCALLDNCACKKNEDCADGQSCSRIDGYPDYPVCKAQPRIHEEDNVILPNPWSLRGLALWARHLRRLTSRMLV